MPQLNSSPIFDNAKQSIYVEILNKKTKEDIEKLESDELKKLDLLSNRLKTKISEFKKSIEIIISKKSSLASELAKLEPKNFFDFISSVKEHKDGEKLIKEILNQVRSHFDQNSLEELADCSVMERLLWLYKIYPILDYDGKNNCVSYAWQRISKLEQQFNDLGQQLNAMSLKIEKPAQSGISSLLAKYFPSLNNGNTKKENKTVAQDNKSESQTNSTAEHHQNTL